MDAGPLQRGDVNPYLSLICYVGWVKLVHQGWERQVPTRAGLNFEFPSLAKFIFPHSLKFSTTSLFIEIFKGV